VARWNWGFLRFGQVNGFVSKPVIQFVLAVLLFLMVGYLLVCDREVPVWLVGIMSSIVGYFFGVRGGEASAAYRISQKLRLSKLEEMGDDP
jgi:hypothetical protein